MAWYAWRNDMHELLHRNKLFYCMVREENCMASVNSTFSPLFKIMIISIIWCMPFSWNNQLEKYYKWIKVNRTQGFITLVDFPNVSTLTSLDESIYHLRPHWKVLSQDQVNGDQQNTEINIRYIVFSLTHCEF